MAFIINCSTGINYAYHETPAERAERERGAAEDMKAWAIRIRTQHEADYAKSSMEQLNADMLIYEIQVGKFIVLSVQARNAGNQVEVDRCLAHVRSSEYFIELIQAEKNRRSL